MADKLDRRAIGLSRLEEWKRIECCPRYFISSFGRVRRNMSGYSLGGREKKFRVLYSKMLTTRMHNAGLVVCLYSRKSKNKRQRHYHFIKALVGKYFVPGIGDLVYKNNDPWDCSVYNIIRVKPKVSAEDNLAIIEALKMRVESYRTIAARYNISEPSICEIANKLRYIQTFYGVGKKRYERYSRAPK